MNRIQGMSKSLPLHITGGLQAHKPNASQVPESKSMSVERTWLAQRVPAPLKLIIKDQFHPSPQSVENLSIPSIITVISNNPGVVYRQPALMLIGHISVREDHHPHISPKCGGQFWRISYCSTVPVFHCIHVGLRIHYHLHWPLIDPWGNFSYQPG